MIWAIISVFLLGLFMHMLMSLFDEDGSKINRALGALFLLILDFCKKHIKILSFIVTLLSIYIFIFLIFLLRTLPSLGIEFHETNYSINYLNVSDEIFYVQSVGNCAAYSIMGVINILTAVKTDPEILAKEIGWRINRNSTFPQGLINLLHRYNIKTKEYSLRLYTDNEKITWLRSQIDDGYPVIILVRVANIQHYVTVLGYDRNGFMLYDSDQERQEDNPRRSIVDKEDLAGNRYYTNDELIRIWNNGGMGIFFRNWAVVCYIS